MHLAHEEIPPQGRHSLKILVGEVNEVTVNVVELARLSCLHILAVAGIAPRVAATKAQLMAAAVCLHGRIVLHGHNTALPVDEGDSSLSPVNIAGASGCKVSLKWCGGT